MTGSTQRAVAPPGAADGEHALLLGVDVDEPPPAQVRDVQRRRAEQTDLLIDGEHGLDRRMGQILRVEQRQRHRHGDAVVAAERRAASEDGVTLYGEIQPLALHILRAVRRLGADHVHVPLHDHGGGLLVARRAGGLDDDIVRRVLMRLESARAAKGGEIVADGLRMAGTVRNGAQLLKKCKDSFRFQI